MNKLLKNYLLPTFLCSYICWGILALVYVLTGVTLNDNALLYILFLGGGLFPAINSFLCLKKNGDVKNFKDWLKNIFNLKHNAASYLLAVVFGILSLLPTCIISGYENGAPLYAIIYLIPMMTVGGGLEEPGWRYFLQPELEKKYSFLVSTLITSVVWWAWHTPLFLIPGVDQYGQNYLAFGIKVIGVSFALACVKRLTGSVWLCILTHAIVNSLQRIFVIDFYDVPGSIATTVICIIVSLILVKVGEKKEIFR